MAAGIASSASGFAALSAAGAAALKLELTPTELSALSRLGSGSASRSIFGGYVEWEQGHDHASSVAHPLFPADHWRLHDIVAVVSSSEKKVSSANGHSIAATSPLNAARIASLPAALATVRDAIAQRDLAQLGPVLEYDALAMHSVMMTGNPSLLYFRPGTLEVLHAVRDWREEGLPAWFTIDAGPNVHVICEEHNAGRVAERLGALAGVDRVISSGPGPAPQLIQEHLF